MRSYNRKSYWVSKTTMVFGWLADGMAGGIHQNGAIVQIVRCIFLRAKNKQKGSFFLKMLYIKKLTVLERVRSIL